MNSKLLPLAVLDAHQHLNSTLQGITPFMKHVFLVQHHGSGSTCYTFTDGHYGPYSMDLYSDITTLAETNFIDRTPVVKIGPFENKYTINEYSLTEKGQQALTAGTNDYSTFDYNYLTVVRTIDRYDTEDTYSLLERVYDLVPDLFAGQEFTPTPGRPL